MCRYTYIAMLEVQHMIDTTWIMSPRPVVPWGLRKALNWVRLEASESLFVITGMRIQLLYIMLYSNIVTETAEAMTE